MTFIFHTVWLKISVRHWYKATWFLNASLTNIVSTPQLRSTFSSQLQLGVRYNPCQGDMRLSIWSVNVASLLFNAVCLVHILNSSIRLQCTECVHIRIEDIGYPRVKFYSSNVRLRNTRFRYILVRRMDEINVVRMIWYV